MTKNRMPPPYFILFFAPDTDSDPYPLLELPKHVVVLRNLEDPRMLLTRIAELRANVRCRARVGGLRLRLNR